MSREKENQERSERWDSFQNDTARARLTLRLEETEGEFPELAPASIVDEKPTFLLFPDSKGWIKC